MGCSYMKINRKKIFIGICFIASIFAASTICGFGNRQVIVCPDNGTENKIVGGAVVTNDGLVEISPEEVKKILKYDEVELNCPKGFKTEILSAKKDINLPAGVYANPLYNDTANPIIRHISISLNQKYETDEADPDDVVKVFNNTSKTAVGLYSQMEYSLSVNVEPGKTLQIKYKPYLYQIKGKQLVYTGHGVYIWKEFSGQFPHVSGEDQLYGLFIYEEIHSHKTG